MLVSVFQHNLIYKNTHKAPPESTLQKASFSGEIKMAAIKPVIR